MSPKNVASMTGSSGGGRWTCTSEQRNATDADYEKDFSNCVKNREHLNVDCEDAVGPLDSLQNGPPDDEAQPDDENQLDDEDGQPDDEDGQPDDGQPVDGQLDDI
ncbi:hypothetical protein DFQ26_002137 [Actinomortierella ambigua]|nr:hypothetical protein DFQ26_002137 [Actinomortierella ambigua]